MLPNTAEAVTECTVTTVPSLIPGAQDPAAIPGEFGG